jgi:hypothetical protein
VLIPLLGDPPRRHLTEGQQAMVTAIAYPEPAKLKRKGLLFRHETTDGITRKARTVLRDRDEQKRKADGADADYRSRGNVDAINSRPGRRRRAPGRGSGGDPWNGGIGWTPPASRGSDRIFRPLELSVTAGSWFIFAVGESFATRRR